MTAVSPIRPARRPAAPVPPLAPRAMPTQDLRAAPVATHGPTAMRVRAARLVAFGGAALLTLWVSTEMLRAFGPEDVGALQLSLRALFALTFAWIAFAATSAVAGVIAAPPRPRVGPVALVARTVIVMPVYDEDAPASFGALGALAEGLAKLGHADAFELFVLSDTRDADALARETTAFAALRDRLGGQVACWYRRRTRNARRKAGNVQDFVARWSRRYDFMLLLDADSLMDPATVVEMTRRMQAAPGLGLLQSAPRLLGGRTAFARLQQFAAAVYGPVVARGVAAWQGEDGNYWGHNALIRIHAFAESAGLPELLGRPPFGGHVLSHDFVEAALLRRAGWAVRMDPDLSGSWEGAPPDLASAAARDRRWAQGNLQHLALIGAAGLRWPSRVHMSIGVASYLVSPLWFGMLAVGLALTAQAALQTPDYFPELRQLFPHWPRFDPARMLALFWLTFGLLATPKAIGLIRALADPRARRRFGGGARLLASGAVEIAASALIAPLQMLATCRHLAEILLGLDIGWRPQSRSGSELPFAVALRAHGPTAIFGLLAALALAFVAPEVLPWLAPVLLGWIAAPALASLAASERLGDRLGRAGILATPDERRTPHAARRAAALARALRRDAATRFADLLADRRLAERHRSIHPPSAPSDEASAVARLTAEAKLGIARGPGWVDAWLSPDEKLALLSAPAAAPA